MVEGRRGPGGISVIVQRPSSSSSISHEFWPAALSIVFLHCDDTATRSMFSARSLLLRALTTPLVLHTNLNRRLRELLLRLALAVHLVLLAGRMAADVFRPAPRIEISTFSLVSTPSSIASLLFSLLAVGRLHVQLILFASGVHGVGVLALGLAAGLS